MGRIERDLDPRITGSATSFVPAIPALRYAEPEEVADLTAYIALDVPAYVTGAALVIDGALRA